MVEEQEMNYYKPLYISLGEDCAISHHLALNGLREFALPFDWAIHKDTNKLIQLIEDIFANNDSIFLNPNNWGFKQIKKSTHLIEGSDTFSKFRAIHLIYKCEYPHEFTEKIIWDPFVDKYTRRINRFKEIAFSYRKVIFIRGFASQSSFTNLHEDLESFLKKYFTNFQDIKYIDYSKYEWVNNCPDGWKRPNINLIDFL